MQAETLKYLLYFLNLELQVPHQMAWDCHDAAEGSSARAGAAPQPSLQENVPHFRLLGCPPLHK